MSGKWRLGREWSAIYFAGFLAIRTHDQRRRRGLQRLRRSDCPAYAAAECRDLNRHFLRRRPFCVTAATTTASSYSSPAPSLAGVVSAACPKTASVVRWRIALLQFSLGSRV